MLVFLLILSSFFALLIASLVIVFAIKYRRRPGSGPTPRILGSAKLEIVWTVVPLMLAMITCCDAIEAPAGAVFDSNPPRSR